MQPEAVIVRLGELTLKGRNRHRFERKLKDQLQALLVPYPRIGLKQEFGRIYIELNGEPYEKIAEGLDKIFGLVSYSPAYQSEMDLEAIRAKGLDLVKSEVSGEATFKVSVNRANKQFPYPSNELSRLVGGYILRGMESLKVDVHNPEIELNVDIRQEEVYLYTRTVAGTGGYPLGSNGKAMLMLSGGIDSPVAGWLAMRRGLEVEAVHFHSYPYTSERAKQKVVDITRRLSQYTDRIKLHLVPFTDIQTNLNDQGQENLMITLMRRSMFRITERLAARSKAGAVITGESLGQVASQTLPSLHAIGKVAALPILRPLIMMDKAEITHWSEHIGTYEISILPYEDCCTLFVPRSPATNPNIKVLDRMEASMEWLEQAEEAAAERTETLYIRWNEKQEFDEYF